MAGSAGELQRPVVMFLIQEFGLVAERFVPSTPGLENTMRAKKPL
jgi:hypothetical protein